MISRVNGLLATLLAGGLLSGITPSPALAVDFGGLAGKVVNSAGGAAHDKLFKEVNAKLLAEGRKNQCTFNTDSDVLAPGCETKLKSLTNTLIEMKKRLKAGGVTDF